MAINWQLIFKQRGPKVSCSCSENATNACLSGGNYFQDKGSWKEEPLHLQVWVTGVLIGLSTFLPFLGNFSGIPGRVMGLVVTALLFIAVPIIRHDLIRPPVLSVGLLISALLFSVLVLTAATKNQWLFVLTPNFWRLAADNYVDGKLLRFIFSLFPYLALATIYMSIRHAKSASVGFLCGILIASAIAVSRLMLSSDLIVRTTYEVARLFYVGGERSFSVVSYAVLFACASVASYVVFSTSQRWLAVLGAGIFIFATSWMNLRVETLLSIAGVLYISLLFSPRPFRCSTVSNVIVSFLIAVFLATALFNEVNYKYWSGDWSSAFVVRADSARETVTQQSSAVVRADSARETVTKERPTGLGSWALLNPKLLYPHNIFLEIYFEVGLGAAILLAVFYLSALVSTGMFLKRPKKQIHEVGIWVCTVVVIVHTLKAGDITDAGLAIMLSIMSAGTCRYTSGNEQCCQ